MLVLGAGPGGYTAAFRAADLGQHVVLVERRPTLGGVCLNVGCIPSKALLHVAKVIDEAAHMGAHGVAFGAPSFDLDKLRGFKDGVVKRLTGGLTALAKQRKVTVVTGEAKFTSANTLAVETAEGRRVVRFAKAIIAAGSEPVAPGFIPKDKRIWDSTGALDLGFTPKRMLVLGGGIIGLEMATVYEALGSRDHRHRDDGPVDAGRRPRHRRAVRQARREALREDHAEDQGAPRSRRGPRRCM